MRDSKFERMVEDEGVRYLRVARGSVDVKWWCGGTRMWLARGVRMIDEWISRRACPPTTHRYDGDKECIVPGS